MKPTKSGKRARVKLSRGQLVKLARELLELHCVAIKVAMRASMAR